MQTNLGFGSSNPTVLERSIVPLNWPLEGEPGLVRYGLSLN